MKVMDEKFRSTGQDSSLHILMGPNTKHFFSRLFIAPLNANSIVNWLHSLQKELFPLLENAAPKENPCGGISLLWDESTPTPINTQHHVLFSQTLWKVPSLI